MRYVGSPEYRHDQSMVTGVLLVNLGTPAAPDRKNVRRYLKQFLSDPRVVELPRWLWWPILNGIILTFRPGRSARAYRQIWTDEGSPLAVHSSAQVESLRNWFEGKYPGQVRLELAMTYGEPSIRQGLENLRHVALKELLILPLYPQYSATTVGSVFDQVADDLKRWRWLPPLRFVHGYHDNVAYIDALVRSVRKHWDDNGRSEHLLISFHGVPERYLHNGDPYYCQCHKTARLVAKKLELDADHWTLVFQSRFGREEWLKPYFDEELVRLARSEVRSLDVICPGFVSDCLETLEEIDVQYRETFLASGGEKFNYIPCLNEEPDHIECLAKLIEERCTLEPDGSEQRRHQLATSAGARQ